MVSGSGVHNRSVHQVFKSSFVNLCGKDLRAGCYVSRKDHWDGIMGTRFNTSQAIERFFLSSEQDALIGSDSFEFPNAEMKVADSFDSDKAARLVRKSTHEQREIYGAPEQSPT